MIIKNNQINTVKLIIGVFASLIVGSIIYSGTAKAEVWPGETWNGGASSNTNMKIKLSQNKDHPSLAGKQVNFSLYRPVNESTSTIKFINTDCGIVGSATAKSVKGSSSNSKIFQKNDCGEKELVVNKSSETPIKTSVGDYYEYAVNVTLNGDYRNAESGNDGFFEFMVKSDYNNGVFGYKRSGATGTQSLPITSGMSAPRSSSDYFIPRIKLPIGSCKISGANTFQLYDSDNGPAFGVQGEGSSFRPLKFSAYSNVSGTGILKRISGSMDQGSNSQGWYHIENNSSTRRTISFDVPQLDVEPGSVAYLQLDDLGKDNYTVLDMPYDEIATKLGCEQPCPPTLCNPTGFNWAIAASTEVSSPYILQGDQASFYHKLFPATAGSWTSNSSSTEFVDVNVLRNGAGIDYSSLDVGVASNNSGGLIDQTYESKLDSNTPPGHYCEKIQFPRGILGKRFSPDWQSKDGFKYSFRWVFMPGKDRGVNADVNLSQVKWVWNSTTNSWGTQYWQYPNGDTNEKTWVNWGDWWLASTVRNPVDNASGHNDTWTAFYNGYQNAYDGDRSDKYWEYDTSGPDYNKVPGWPYLYNTPEACIDVLKPDLSDLPNYDYEKGENNNANKVFDHKVSVPGCPAAGIGVSARITGYEGNGTYYDTTVSGSVNPGNDCTFTTSKTLNASYLNSQNPGTVFSYSTTLLNTGEMRTGSVKVAEVPFARFYGNDVYATNATTGNIRFNDSYNNDSANFDGRGSLAQYAAFSTNATILLDTAAGRYNSVTGATLPPNGLSSNNMPTLPGLSADLQHSTAKSKLPPNCTAITTAAITPDATGCYVKESGNLTVNGANYKSRTTIKGSNVIIGGQLNNTSFDPSPTDIGATFYQHIERNTRPTETSGYARGLTVGTYVLPTAVSATLPQMKDLSSVDVSPYYKVTMYDENGNWIVLDDYKENFLSLPRPGGSWNDAVTKIVVEKLDPASYNTEATGVLLIIADNIYIDKSVQRLDAILVAKENIYTCANGTNPVSNGQLVSDCRLTLTVNGSMSAPNISFQRSVGSRFLNKGSSDLPNSYEICLGFQGVRNCGARWYGTANANTAPQAEINASGGTAEIINFPAYLYWAKPLLIDESGVGGTYKAIYTAPPRK